MSVPVIVCVAADADRPNTTTIPAADSSANSFFIRVSLRKRTHLVRGLYASPKRVSICDRLFRTPGTLPGKRRNRDDELYGIDRFRKVHLETGSKRFHPVFSARVCGQRRGGNITYTQIVRRTDTPDQLKAIAFDHADVREQHVRVTSRERVEPSG